MINICAFGIAILIMAVMCLVLVYTFVYPMLYFARIQTHPDFNERHAFLFLEFKRHRLK